MLGQFIFFEVVLIQSYSEHQERIEIERNS